MFAHISYTSFEGTLIVVYHQHSDLCHDERQGLRGIEDKEEGPRTEPCGTPKSTEAMDDMSKFTRTY